MGKVIDKFKEYKVLIGITVFLIVLCVCVFVFTKIKLQGEDTVNYKQYFETPNRIVYKEKAKDNYYVFAQGSRAYTDILNEVINGFDSKEEGKIVPIEEIEKIEQNENYIELDYDTISKNYIIAYEQEKNNVILRTDNGGQVVKQNLKNRDDLSKLLEAKISSNNIKCYHMEDSKEYNVTNEIPIEVFESNNSDFKQYQDRIYGIKIQNKEFLDEILERYNIELEEEIPNDIFDKTDIILMVSKYSIENIETRIGGVTYYFTGNNRQDSYLVSIFAASKAINTNCVYRNLDNIIANNSSLESNSNVDNTVTITKEQAATIAEEEAKKDKYQYQPWKSDFSVNKFFCDENGNYEISAELLYSLDDIHRLYYWEESWEVKDSSGNNLYQGQPVWCVRLGDNNDPLTSLYIYIDANNGNVLGAGKSSD